MTSSLPWASDIHWRQSRITIGNMFVRYRFHQPRNHTTGQPMSLFSYASIAVCTPDAKHARQIVQALRERRILTGTDGPHNNVIKIQPPMLVGVEHVDRFVGELDEALGTKLPTSTRN
jgi:hypothetical protein